MKKILKILIVFVAVGLFLLVLTFFDIASTENQLQNDPVQNAENQMKGWTAIVGVHPEPDSTKYFVPELANRTKEGNSLLGEHYVSYYDEKGYLDKTIGYNDEELCWEITYKYHQDGSILEKYEHRYVGFSQKHRYDISGNETETVYYDKDNNQERWYKREYDAEGFVEKEILYGENDEMLHWSSFRYFFAEDGIYVFEIRHKPDDSVECRYVHESNINGSLRRFTQYNPDGTVDSYEYDDLE